MTTKTKAVAEPKAGRPIDSEPMSRQEVFEKERQEDERRRQRHAEQGPTAAKARRRVMSEGPKPMNQEEIVAKEARRLEVAREREQATGDKYMKKLREIAVEENERNGRGQGITVRA